MFCSVILSFIKSFFQYFIGFMWRRYFSIGFRGIVNKIIARKENKYERKIQRGRDIIERKRKERRAKWKGKIWGQDDSLSHKRQRSYECGWLLRFYKQPLSAPTSNTHPLCPLYIRKHCLHHTSFYLSGQENQLYNIY